MSFFPESATSRPEPAIAERAQKQWSTLVARAEKAGYRVETYQFQGEEVVCIGLLPRGLSQAELDHFCHLQNILARDKRRRNCQGVAAMLCHIGEADGVFKTRNKDQGVSEYSTHAIPYMEHQGMVFALDATAPEQIQMGLQGGRVLILGFTSLEGLQVALRKLYEGIWERLDPEEIKDDYTLAYPDTEEQQAQAYRNIAERIRRAMGVYDPGGE